MLNSEQIIEQNKDVYNNIAAHFSSTRAFLWRDLESLAGFVKPKDRVLDIGCGNGRLYQIFANLSISFTGIDISEKLIEIAKERYPKCSFEVANMTELPFEGKKFDVIFSLVAFHHLPTQETQLKALEEMKRVLKSKGKIILLNWNAYSDWVKNKLKEGEYEDLGNQLFRVPWKTQVGENIGDRVYYGFTLAELENLAELSGLKMEDQYFLRHSERVDVKKGMNVVSVLSKA